MKSKGLDTSPNKLITPPKIHPQAIYKSRLLNPFVKDLPKYDDIVDDNSSEIID